MSDQPIVTVKWKIPIRFMDPACRAAWAEFAEFEATGTTEQVEIERQKFMQDIDKFKR